MDKALVLTGVKQLAFENLPERSLAPDEVRIRTLFSGVSAGTELSQFRGTSLHVAAMGRRQAGLPRWGATLDLSGAQSRL